MLEFIRHLFTTADNRTGDVGRVLWAVLCLAYVGLTAASLWRGGAFDPMTWAGGAGALLAAGGGALALKRGTEP